MLLLLKQFKEIFISIILKKARSFQTILMPGTIFQFTFHFIFASIFMWQHRDPEKRFSVVDIDPYGGADPFLDAAVQAVDDGGILLFIFVNAKFYLKQLFMFLILFNIQKGLLCVTCTDMAVLCGNHPEVAFTKYGSMPLHAKYCHEQALRIVLMSIQSHASRYYKHFLQ